ncbi:MAG: mandelate racemase/muconate lactonizing enzyme family protein [Dehalococcoidia bacterium]|nr:mandelate racemase/muconate lactonizing enzyme family protein [Dehalococcoidia bacterium]
MTGQDKNAPRIVSIELTPVVIPFQEIVREAMSKAGGLGMAIPAEEAWTGIDCAICKMVDESGNVGLGESYVWWPETGTSPNQIIEVIRQALAKYVLGESPFDAEKICQRMDNNVARSEAAKGLLDMALYDLMGKVRGVPACEVLGGKATDIPLAALIPLMDPDGMVFLSKMFFDDGYRTLRLKLGHGIAEDVAILQAMRKEFGQQVRIRVDYNQAYSPQEAVTAITSIEPFDIDVAEQPVAATNYVGMAYVQKRVKTPLMSHEGCFSLGDIITLAELGAIRVVGINTERPGGITAAFRAMDFATEHGMKIVIHNQSAGISSAALIHLAAARLPTLGHAVELFGYVMLEDDLITSPIDYSGGIARVPAGPGWGVKLDTAALDKYATGPTVKLTLP